MEDSSALPQLPPAERCNARTRQGAGYCQQRAGWGTDHVGHGRCKLHGGLNPVRHGRYSSRGFSQDLAELVAAFEADPDPLDATPELALARAVLTSWLERHEELTDALIAWNSAEMDQAFPRPARLPDVRDIAPLLEQVSRAVKRVHDIHSANAISRKDLLRVLSEMGRITNLHVPDEVTRERIARDWAQIRLA